jgi:hypothetical protein
MLWKVADGIIGAEGTVSVVEPYAMLRFSYKVNDPTTSKQEDLTYRLEERDGHTQLSVLVGDFGDTPEHELCYPGAVESRDLWDVLTSLPVSVLITRPYGVFRTMCLCGHANCASDLPLHGTYRVLSLAVMWEWAN